MAWTREEIDKYLDALDTGLMAMRDQCRGRKQMLASFDYVATRIRTQTGQHRDYVSARLLAIRLANELGPDVDLHDS